MLKRTLLPELRRRLARYPAVALVGPRQCGKTTLAQMLGGAYYDLEQESERLRLDLEWAARTAGQGLPERSVSMRLRASGCEHEFFEFERIGAKRAYAFGQFFGSHGVFIQRKAEPCFVVMHCRYVHGQRSGRMQAGMQRRIRCGQPGQ